jgi:pyroglutamyl-peptidase
MKVLLTGFEPFGGSQVNPSAQVVHTLVRDGVPGVTLHPTILPVDRQGGPATLLNAVRVCQPDVILCLGEAARRPTISIERVALNLLDYRMADNSGHQAVDEPVVPDGPAAYFVTLPVRAMLDAVQAAGIPADCRQAGADFCAIQVTYELLHYLRSTNSAFRRFRALPAARAVTNAYPLMLPWRSKRVVWHLCGYRAFAGDCSLSRGRGRVRGFCSGSGVPYLHGSSTRTLAPRRQAAPRR